MNPDEHRFLPFANPVRNPGCVRCGRVRSHPIHVDFTEKPHQEAERTMPQPKQTATEPEEPGDELSPFASELPTDKDPGTDEGDQKAQDEAGIKKEED